MSKEHVVKTLTKFFEPACDGRKPFEVRINDRDYEVGDVLVQKEWDSIGGFSGYETRSTITYVLDDPAYCRPGYVVLGLRDQDVGRMTEIQDKYAEIIRQRERIDKLDSELHKQNCRNQDQTDEIERLRAALNSLGSVSLDVLHMPEAAKRMRDVARAAGWSGIRQKETNRMDKLEMTHAEKAGLELRGWLHACEEIGCDPVELVGPVKSAELVTAVTKLQPMNPNRTVNQTKERIRQGLLECIDRLIEEAKLL